MVATANDVKDPNTTDAAGAHSEMQARQRWCLVFSQGKTAIFDRNMGDGTEAATRTRAFTGMGIPGWDGAFLAGDLDYPNTFVLTEEGATGRLIRVNITFSAESPTATVDALTNDYDDGLGGGYTTIADPSNTLSIQDQIESGIVFDYRRPRQTNVISEVGTVVDDIQTMRENIVAQMMTACYRGHLHTQYIGIPGATVTETPTDSLTPTQILVDFTTPGLEFKYEFTYYETGMFGGTLTLPKRVTMSAKKGAGESFYQSAQFEYQYKANGMLFSARPV